MLLHILDNPLENDGSGIEDGDHSVEGDNDSSIIVVHVEGDNDSSIIEVHVEGDNNSSIIEVHRVTTILPSLKSNLLRLGLVCRLVLGERHFLGHPENCRT